MKKTNAKVQELVTLCEKTIAAETTNEAAWESSLLQSCAKDLEHLETEFGDVIPLDRLNYELTLAAHQFFQAFKSKKALRPPVARIINLLQMFTLSYKMQNQINYKHLN